MTSLVDRPANSQTLTKIGAGRRFRNGLATGLVVFAFLLALVPLLWVLFTVLRFGIAAVTTSTWWTHSLSGLLSSQSGGGVYHAIYGTVIQAVVCALFSVPIGLMVGIYLVEYGGRSRLSKITTFMVDILTGVPSIVAALFIYTLWITILGFPRSGFAVSLALILLMVPVIVRTTEEMLKVVPNDLREACYALGVPKWKTIVKIVIPTALSGIVTGIMLALARVMGETAPLLVLVGYAPFINFDLFDGNMAALPLVMVSERNNPSAVGVERMWGAALTLVLLITVFNLIATIVSRRSAIKTK